MLLKETDLLEAFLVSDYFTEENLLKNTHEIAKLFNSDIENMVDYFRELPRNKRPVWLFPENMSDELKLLFELTPKPQRDGYCDAKVDRSMYFSKYEAKKITKELKKEREIELYD